MSHGIWDWALWPYIIARGAWRAALGAMTDAIRDLSERLYVISQEIGVGLLPAMQRLAAVFAR